MKRSFGWLVSLALLFACQSAAQTIVEGGNVSGIWAKEASPFLVKGTISVPVDSVLVIGSGVKIRFNGHYKLEVYGQLLAHGTAGDSIVFTAEDPETGWHGIRLLNGIANAQDTSRLAYCRLEYGKAAGSCPDNRGGAIYAGNARLVVSHCLLRHNQAVSGAADWGGGAIYCDQTNAVITGNLICNNYSGHDGGAVYCSFCAPQISGNIFEENEAAMRGGAIGVFSFASPDICNNSIRYNNAADKGGAIYCSGGSAHIHHNNIDNNQSGLGGAVALYLSNACIVNNLINNNSAGAGGAVYAGGSSPVIACNTICNNTASLYGGGIAVTFEMAGVPVYGNPEITAGILYGNSSDDGSQLWSAGGCMPVIRYCDVQDINNLGVSGEVSMPEGNTDLPPAFSATGTNPFELSRASPCIDAGPGDLAGFTCPECDLNGCVRIWDGDGDLSAVVDMGAFEYGSQALGIEEQNPETESVFICKVYPNPAKDRITFSLTVPEQGITEIRVLLPDGRTFRAIRKTLSADENKLDIGLSRLPAGVYIYEVYYMNHRKSGRIVVL